MRSNNSERRIYQFILQSKYVNKVVKITHQIMINCLENLDNVVGPYSTLATPDV